MDLESPRGPELWLHTPGIDYLNHGSFGGCPRPVIEAQHRWQWHLERQACAFMVGELEPGLDAVRTRLGALLGCDPDDLALVSNATEGVGTVVRSLPFGPGDEVLVLDHTYNACKNAVDVELQRRGGRSVVAKVPFPLFDPAEATEAIVAALTPRTRLAVIDHVTSPTGIVLPIADLVARIQARGVDVLVDAAHVPGMMEVNLDALGAAYWTGNCHKWLCSPKGSAVLHVRRDRQEQIRPLVISHGANSPRTDRSRFRVEFDWTGTRDPSPWLAIPDAIDCIGNLWPGGWAEHRQRNRALALAARDVLCEALGTAPPAPDAMVSHLAAVVLPEWAAVPGHCGAWGDPLHDWLWQKHRIEVPVFAWRGLRILRIAAQAYNHLGQYRRLARVLVRLRAGGEATA
ncbi:MAG: aminotransferase class V-fold PLP-dependent enzyme [Deltaproteobacteria bacterium]|nr:aminotransferase class V-fold PLP-dependent enzyme [Deltaproteobacteria bacterium]